MLSRASVAWPTVPAEIKSAWVDVQGSYRNSSDDNRRYIPRVNYAYAVGDQQYLGTRIDFNALDLGFAFERKAKKIIANYPVGTTLPVAYDPADPNTAVLDLNTKPRAVNFSTMLFFFFTVFIAVMGMMMFFVRM